MTMTHQLLTQLFALLALGLVMFVELGLGYFPAFHGVAPKLMLTWLYLMLVYDEEPPRLISLFMLGIIYDSLEGNPLGYTSGALILVAISGHIAHGQTSHLFRPPLSSLWITFAFVMLVGFAYSVGVMLAYYQTTPAVGYVLFQYAATVLLFPLVLGAQQSARRLSAFLRGTP